MLDSFQNKILNTNNKYQMVAKGEKVLVGFSGGPDSMVLLHILNELKDLLDIKIYALHINHQLRAKAADEDEKFALQICKKFRIPIRSIKIDVKRFAKANKMSIEESARVLRYKYFEKEAKRLGCNKIALGHNANDNAETIILNLVRGTGLAGLSGIPPVRDNIIRPLIAINRKEIINYLKQRKLIYCHDRTNIELGYRRNYIRHKIIPLLYNLNPNLIETVRRTSEIIRIVNEGIVKLADAARKNVVLKSSKDSVVLDIKKFLSYNLFIRRQIIKNLLPKMEFEQIESLLALTKKPSGKRLELTDDWIAWKEGASRHILQVMQRSCQHTERSSRSCWKVNIGKTTKIPEIELELIARITKKGRVTKNSKCEVFDKSQITLPLSIRLRRPGDRFIPFKGKEKS